MQCMLILFFGKYYPSAPTGGKRRGGAGGLNKVCGVSPELQAIVGEPALPRTEVVTSWWLLFFPHIISF